ncbi:MAG TPA: AAA family ATPase [Desulfomonilia bacterium]
MTAKIISISNQKGGVGKTTTAVNLSASLSLLGCRVLLVDFDPQSNTSSGIGVVLGGDDKHIYHSLIGSCPFNEIIRETRVKNLFLAPSNNSLIGSEIELLEIDSRESVLSDILKEQVENYDYIIIDCPPSLGLLTLNALTACDSLLVPVQCEYFALEGLKSLLGTFDLVKKRLNPSIIIEGFLLTMFDSRTRLSHDISENVRHHFGDRVFNTVIPRNIKLCEAPSYGLPICLYDISSKGAQHYLMLAREINERYSK